MSFPTNFLIQLGGMDMFEKHIPLKEMTSMKLPPFAHTKIYTSAWGKQLIRFKHLILGADTRTSPRFIKWTKI